MTHSKNSNTSGWARPLFLAGLTLVSFVFFNILFSSVLFIFKIGITAAAPAAALLFSVGITVYFAEKVGLCRRRLVVVLVLALAVMAVSLFLAGMITDHTYDGNCYHKTAIGMLRDGWNPVYENMEEFDARSEQSFGITEHGALWENHYARASHTFAANIYKVTGNVETGKSINLISLAALFLIAVSYLLHKGKRPLFIAVFAVILCSCPVFLVQLLTNYVDLLLGIYLFILIFCFFFLEEQTFFPGQSAFLLLFFMVLCIMINIKFSSFAYAGIYCLGYYLWYLYRLWKKELDKTFFIRFTAVAAAAVVVGVLVIGLSVYPKNLIDHGHPFYPLFGEGKVDIMTTNSPFNFPELSPIQRFLAATFSRVDNPMQFHNTAPEFKLPFTWEWSEFGMLYIADLRISGHGIFFGGILIISLIALAAGCVRFAKQKMLPLILIPLCINGILIFAMGEVWWARYFPQLFLFPLFAVLLLDELHCKPAAIANVILVLALLANNGATGLSTANHTITYMQKMQEQYARFDAAVQSAQTPLILSSGIFRGSFYNVFDRLPEDTEFLINLVDIPPEEAGDTILLNGFMHWQFLPDG